VNAANKGDQSIALRAGVLVAGVLALVLGPILVAVKYQTGWRVIPIPSWLEASGLLDVLNDLAPATQLWTWVGMAYSVTLAVLLLGFVRWRAALGSDIDLYARLAYATAAIGLAMTLGGDAVHSALWHRTGITIPTPGSDPLPNRAYAIHMMGMNLLMIGSLALGIVRLRRGATPRWLSWGLIAVLPSGILASLTWLPTTPSGALWWFHLLMVLVAAKRPLAPPPFGVPVPPVARAAGGALPNAAPSRP